MSTEPIVTGTLVKIKSDKYYKSRYWDKEKESIATINVLPLGGIVTTLTNQNFYEYKQSVSYDYIKKLLSRPSILETIPDDSISIRLATINWFGFAINVPNYRKAWELDEAYYNTYFNVLPVEFLSSLKNYLKIKNVCTPQ